MADHLIAKLNKLATAARKQGHHPLALAAAAVAAQSDDLDLRINLVGALHECGKLRNVLEPFWRAWRSDQAVWLARAAERLQSGDADYWAVASLLGTSLEAAVAEFAARGLTIACVRHAGAPFSPLLKVVTLAPARQHGERLWAPVIELGEDPKRSEIVDAVRCRAVIFKSQEQIGSHVVGAGNASNYLRAALPHGAWRSVSLEYSLQREEVAPT